MKAAIANAVLFALLTCSSSSAQKTPQEIFGDSGIRAGLVVQIGCSDLALATNPGEGSLIIQGLDTDPTNVERARAFIHSRGRCGTVSADRFNGRKLPYVDNLVNLIIAADLGAVPMPEVMRVLCPGGKVYIKANGGWGNKVKPWPDTIDQWTHYLHGPDNNAVAQDSVVGPPRHFQWISKPRFSRSHDHLASVSAVVSAAGKVFYIVDEGSTAFVAASPRWRLVARDAFNGVKLWERSISTWEYHLRDFRSGPADIARRLVAIGDRVYVTLGYGQPVSVLDAATGKTLHVYKGTEGTGEILYKDGTLFLVLGVLDLDWKAQRAKEIVSQKDYVPPFENYTPPLHQMRVMAVDSATGELKWEMAGSDTRTLMPVTLAVSGGNVYFQNADAIMCLDARSGTLKWRTPRPVQRQRLGWSTPTLVVHDGVVFSADRKAEQKDGELLWMPSGGYHEYIRGEGIVGELIAYDGATGKQMWSCPAYEGFNSPVDIMIADGLVWTGRIAWGNDPGFTEARDPKTGEVRRRRPSDDNFLPRIGHARCHRCKGTSKYILLGRRGVEFVDLTTGDMIANKWVRGICHYGFMPANGLLYIPPHSCACSTDDLLKTGFTVLASGSGENAEVHPASDSALERGPAFGYTDTRQGVTDRSDWPTYRQNASRGGATSAAVPHELTVGWTSDLGGKLSSPVVADGVLLVAQSDEHHVHALDASTGAKLWSHTAGARIDSPPTINDRQVLFGSADGSVYCLRLSDGALIWRFHAAPKNRRFVVDGQLESPWPVRGTVLVLDGCVYFTAGRTTYLDGGMFLYKLDAATGRVLQAKKLDVEVEKRDGGFATGGHLPDVLSSDGNSLFMRIARFDLNLERQPDNVPHLWSPVGFLDDSWWHRTYWQIGVSMGSGWGGWPKAGRKVPAGRLLVTDGSRVFGYGRNQYDIPGAHVGVDGEGVWGPIGPGLSRWTHYQLFGKTIDTRPSQQARREPKQPTSSTTLWANRVPILAQALVLSNDKLFVAGPLDPVKEIPQRPADVDPLAEALTTTEGGKIVVVQANDGTTLATYDLKSPPVFDGMAATENRLYLSTKNGQVVCMKSAK